ncbi:MAG: BBE domain-containing protein, partial [Burkholderiales bacterium]
PAESDRHIAWARQAAAQMEPHAGVGAYVNFLGEEGRQGARLAYRDAYGRLLALKNEYDPGNFFRLNQNIEPGAGAATGRAQ